jgi:hypothetical protein
MASFWRQHGLGDIFKAVFLYNGQGNLANLIERSGAQGVYPHNQMVTLEECRPMICETVFNWSSP